VWTGPSGAKRGRSRLQPRLVKADLDLQALQSIHSIGYVDFTGFIIEQVAIIVSWSQELEVRHGGSP